jgi:hypothetical protein
MHAIQQIGEGRRSIRIKSARDTHFGRFNNSPWLNIASRQFGAARRVPTMLSNHEQKLYFWLASNWAQGLGAIVDLGCFVGGSTARLAAGQRIAERASTPQNSIYAYDQFTVAERNKQRALYPAGIAPFDGSDMLGLSQELLSPWQDQIYLRRGRIEDIGWHGDPIEILTLDAMKTYRTMHSIALNFFPHMIPGRSVIAHQDFLRWNQPFLAAQMSLLRDFFTPVAWVAEDTVVYLCTRAITRADVEIAKVASLSLDAKIKHLEATKRLLGRWGLDERIDAQIATLRHNPKQTKSWKMIPAS